MSLVKEALDPAEARKNYYLRNRDKIKREGKKYRLERSGEIARKKRRYRRQLSAGARVVQGRAKAGLGYVSLGVKPQVSSPTAAVSDSYVGTEKRI